MSGLEGDEQATQDPKHEYLSVISFAPAFDVQNRPVGVQQAHEVRGQEQGLPVQQVQIQDAGAKNFSRRGSVASRPDFTSDAKGAQAPDKPCRGTASKKAIPAGLETGIFDVALILLFSSSVISSVHFVILGGIGRAMGQY